MGTVIDLFAGPGGWSEGGRALGLTEIGLEHDAAACATRAAAGHRTIRADVAAYPLGHLPPLTGLIASPPCPTFSAAGSRGGIAELPYLIGHVHRCITGWQPYAPPSTIDVDERSALVLEPLRWALDLVPKWIALEQVPDVLPVWEAYAHTLRALGWSVWCGILEAERYGVPQTRERAFLLAHRRRHVEPPEPTHQRYVKDEPARHEVTMFGEVLPWVSMADALGWGMTARPYPTIASGRGTGGPDKEKVGGSGARAALYAEQDARRWQLRERQEHGAVRLLDEPAPTITADARCFSPGGHIANDGRDNSQMVGRSENAIKLGIAEALILQSFRPDYPVQGTKTKQFEQIGNAVPPLLARHVLSAITGRTTQ